MEPRRRSAAGGGRDPRRRSTTSSRSSSGARGRAPRRAAGHRPQRHARSAISTTRSCSRPRACAASPIDPSRATARVEAGVDLAGRRRARRPSTAWRRSPAPRRTSASSATRSAAASAGSRASTASRANQVTAIELVTADGELRPRRRRERAGAVLGASRRRRQLRRRDRDRVRPLPDHRGLRRLADLPVERAGEVLARWRDWTETVPDEITSVGRILQLPPLPYIPEPMRGTRSSSSRRPTRRRADEARRAGRRRSVRSGRRWTRSATCRSRARSTCTWTRRTGRRDRRRLTARRARREAIDAFVAAAVGTPILAAEVRHLGGAVGAPAGRARRPRRVRGPYLAFAVGLMPVPELATRSRPPCRLVERLEPWAPAHVHELRRRAPRRAEAVDGGAHHRLSGSRRRSTRSNLIRSNDPLS